MALALSTEANGSAGSGTAAAASSNELLSGVASVLKEASAALARLGVTAGLGGTGADQAAKKGGGTTGDGVTAGASLKNAAAALAQAAAALKITECVEQTAVANNESEAPCMTPTEFVETHGLEAWVGDVLGMLHRGQQAAVMNPQLNTERARNPSGIVMSRIKQVAPVEQRIELFIRVNDLAEGVVDRLSTLTPQQLEAVMESGLKIQKAVNPSGVAMKRITEVVRALPTPRTGRVALVGRREGHSQITSYGCRGRDRGYDDYGAMPADVLAAMEDLGLEQWCGEVLRRLSLWQRQTVIREIGTMRSVRNPSGVVMSRIRSIAKVDELISIFVDINGLDRNVEAQLWELTPEQRSQVIAPGIYMQNARNASTAVKTRIQNVLEGRSAMSRPAIRYDSYRPELPVWRGNEDRAPPVREEPPRHSGRTHRRHRKRVRPASSSSYEDDEESEEDASSATPPPPRRRRRMR